MGQSLITSEVATVISGFASSLMPTVLALVAIVIPVGLSLWALGFGLRKGIGYLQRLAQRSI